jgi:hypothetical protein
MKSPHTPSRPGRRWLGPVLVGLLVTVPTPRPAPAADCRVVADFSHDQVGAFPVDWRPKEQRAREVYRVLAEGGLRFVRATAEGTGLQMGKELTWSLAAQPVLEWKWRPMTWPTGADERRSGRNDSALGVYAVFPHTTFSVKAVKYVWSARAPVGATASASMGLTRMIVLRSGPSSRPGWVEERVNVARDYQRLFGETPASPIGIAVLTDADDTKSEAVGDYAAFRVCAAGG